MSAVITRPQATPNAPGRHVPEWLDQYDPWLLGLALILIGFGLVLVASASITVAERNFGAPLYYFIRQSCAAALGLGLAFVVLKLPLKLWQQLDLTLLLAGLVLLVLVLIPGIGVQVNGSMRWIDLGPVSLQASEPVKLCVIVYLAGYLVRRAEWVRTSLGGFIRPIAVLTLIAGLLLLEPDYGASVVLFATALGMLFLGGVPLGRFVAWVAAASTALFALAILSPYRLQRLLSFLDPWQDPFNTGFQLTQALIAFGRGDWFGVGLGGSVQKLFYLPEAHTDFVFAVLAEEFGFIGCALVILIFALFVWRAMTVGQLAMQNGLPFAAYLAYGVGLVIGIQAFVNIGVNMGVLPTKGLTLPLLSYGSNSLIVTCILLALLVRADYEVRAAVRARLAKIVTHYAAA